MRENILTTVVIRFQICIFDILNTALRLFLERARKL